MIANERGRAGLAVEEARKSSGRAGQALDVWCITDLVLCNFECPYCCAYRVVTTKKTWETDESYQRFLKITERLSQAKHDLRLRLQTLGEPFVAKEFIQRAGWLSGFDHIQFVELVTNASLLKQRLKLVPEAGGELSKISLWATYHHTEIELEKFLDNVSFAQDQGCFVVVNALAFPDSIDRVEDLHAQATARGLRVNVDPGYSDGGGEYESGPLVAMESVPGGMERLRKLTVNQTVLDANLMAAVSADGEPCAAGGEYFIVLADGRVGPCCPLLNKGVQYGNLLDDGFELKPGKKKYQICNVDRRVPVLGELPLIGSRFRTPFPCKNKEDFGHLKVIRENAPHSAPSLGWFAE